MEQRYKDFLIANGYKQYTPSGQPSTVFAYIRRIYYVCERERMTWDELARNINKIVNEYNWGGSKEDFGAKSQNAIISALRRYKEFVSEHALLGYK
ncbi:MAG: hypothetical protein LBK70_00105 [Clostridiales bacterium]|jgi:hypothetical protein|nr:hypothetical protein [Clostridiales bacterium]